MSALGAQSPTARAAAQALPVQPAEIVLDGAKWCNLLAAPVTTPSLALSALSTALPASPLQGPNRTGPLWLANSMLQVNHPWLVGGNGMVTGTAGNAYAGASEETQAPDVAHAGNLVCRCIILVISVKARHI